MKGYDPGGNEWPTNLKLKHVGGSSSSFRASSNLVFFRELNNVLPAVFDVKF